jgi:RNA polymerase sigma factor for flagellar operon FliA
VPDEAPEVLARFQAELGLVDIVARQLARKVAQCVTVDDLCSFGREGLLRAARNFDVSLGIPFRRWANLRIKGAMIDGVRKWGDLPRSVARELRALEAGDRMLEQYDQEDGPALPLTPEAADERLSSRLADIATAIALGTVSQGDDSTPEDRLGQEEMLALVKRVVTNLPERERTLIERHYFAGETLDDAAASLGLSKSWGRRLHARAIESLTRELRKLGEL